MSVSASNTDGEQEEASDCGDDNQMNVAGKRDGHDSGREGTSSAPTEVCDPDDMAFDSDATEGQI